MIQSPNMQYPQPSGANAVAINIFNPQAYGSGVAQLPVQQQAPWGYTSPIYQMPQASLYAPQASQLYQQPMMPMQAPVMQQPMPAPVMQQPIAPQPMPISVMPQEQTAPQTAVEAQTVAQPQTQAAEAQAQTPVKIVEPQEAPAQVVNVDELVQNLKNPDMNVKSETINKIAAYVQESPETALQVVSEPIMQGLIDIVNEDTTALEGPTKEQIAVAEKIAKGEQLTPEENAISEQLCPRDMANTNRIFALYTLAMIQKLQREELNQYIENQKANGETPIAPLKVQDLIGYNDMVNVIKNETVPRVKVAAIQALDHVVEPQDKETIQPILQEAANSTDEAVKQAANEAMNKLAAAPAPAQAA